jgi:hypothetical protein
MVVSDLPKDGNEKPIANKDVAFMKSLRELFCFILVVV